MTKERKGDNILKSSDDLESTVWVPNLHTPIRVVEFYLIVVETVDLGLV